MPESGFTVDKIMHLYIKFHRLVLTRGSSYNELPKWIKSKKTVINPEKNHEERFKWAAIAAIHHEDHQRISKLDPCENQYNWEVLEFPVLINKMISLKRTTLA